MISLEREWDFFVHLQSWRESWAILFSVKNGTYFVYIAMMLKCVQCTCKRQKSIQWKALENMKINQFFPAFTWSKTLSDMCNVHHHLGAIFPERISRKTYGILKNRNERNKCITYTHTHTLADTLQYAVQSKWICVCEQGDELQTLCVSLLWMFNFALQKVLHPQLLLQQCGQSNWKHEQHIYCITQMYTDEMLP